MTAYGLVGPDSQMTAQKHNGHPICLSGKHSDYCKAIDCSNTSHHTWLSCFFWNWNITSHAVSQGSSSQICDVREIMQIKLNMSSFQCLKVLGTIITKLNPFLEMQLSLPPNQHP